MSERPADERSPPARALDWVLHLPLALSARWAGTLLAGALAAGGAILVWQSALLELGRVGLPGPGFLPLLLGVLLCVSATMIAVTCWRSGEAEKIELGHRDVLITVAALLAVPPLFEPLGAYLTLGLFGTAMLVLIARVALPLAVAAAALAMAACWYFFQVLLGLQLPMGPF
jgi:hypothetical protein